MNGRGIAELPRIDRLGWRRLCAEVLSRKWFFDKHTKASLGCIGFQMLFLITRTGTNTNKTEMIKKKHLQL